MLSTVKGSILMLVFVVGLLFIWPKKVLAAELVSPNFNTEILRKKIAMHNVLERYDSPLVDEVDSFLVACMTYEINCYLLPSISGVESTFGRFLLPETHNAFGWGGGYLAFQTWEDAFLTIAKGLRENYIDQGLTTVEMIGPVYAPPSTTWSNKVLLFMSQFEKEEANINTAILEI